MSEIGPDASEINIFPNYPEKYRVTLDQVDEKIRRIFDSPQIRHDNDIIEEAYWKADKFDLVNEVHKTNGPIVEVGGPTSGNDLLLDFNHLNKKLYVSNMAPGLPIYDPYKGGLLKHIGRIDIRLDATALPLKPNSVGVLVGANLPHDISQNFFREASQALESGGFLLFQGGTRQDFFDATMYSLIPVQYRKKVNKHHQESWDIVFKKGPLKRETGIRRGNILKHVGRMVPLSFRGKR